MIKGAVRKKRVIDGCLQLDKDIARENYKRCFRERHNKIV